MIYWELPLNVIEEVISKLSPDVKVFSTIEFIKMWEKIDKKSVNEYEELRGRNWRAIIGKLLKKYSYDTSKIRQITPAHISPARWQIIK